MLCYNIYSQCTRGDRCCVIIYTVSVPEDRSPCYNCTNQLSRHFSIRHSRQQVPMLKPLSWLFLFSSDGSVSEGCTGLPSLHYLQREASGLFRPLKCYILIMEIFCVKDESSPRPTPLLGWQKTYFYLYLQCIEHEIKTLEDLQDEYDFKCKTSQNRGKN